jgi:hypothetical protein
VTGGWEIAQKFRKKAQTLIRIPGSIYGLEFFFHSPNIKSCVNFQSFVVTKMIRFEWLFFRRSALYSEPPRAIGYLEIEKGILILSVHS